MTSLKINKTTKTNISYCVGEDYDTIVNWNPSDERQLIKNVTFSKQRDLRKIGRGNPLLSRKKIKTIDDVNKMIARIK